MKIILTEKQMALIHRSIIKESSQKPQTKDEIIKFQNWVINTKKDKTILGKWGADGDWGDLSEKAWKKYGSSYNTNTSKKEYPFDVLSRNPQSKDIAEIIKKSNGGWFRNDYEAWAEAAFNKIGNKDRYQKVSSLLGKDVYEYIKDYMNTSKIYHEGPSIDTTYNKLFNKNKVKSDTESKKPKTESEIINFQTFAKQKGFKNVTGRKKGQLISVDGSWGKNSEAAWQKYGSSYNPTKQKSTENTGDTSWLKSTSKQVKNQIQYLMNQGFNKPFTVVDDINSKVYAVNSDYSIYGVYNVITGKDRGDEIKDVTFSDWYMENPLDNTWQFLKDVFTSKKEGVENKIKDSVNHLDHEYFEGTKLWVKKNTPSGVFTADKSPGNWLESKAMTRWAEKDYGKRFIGFNKLDGSPLAVGFHGTKNKERIDITKDDWTDAVKKAGGNYSFGCVNFKDADIQNVNNFITNGQYSFWLPDSSTNIVELPKGSFLQGILKNLQV